MALNEHEQDRHSLTLVEGKAALCRCWQSKKFPYCDGSHRQYNQDNNDNLGPVIVSVSQE